ncbi:hypothetical protein Tco_1044998 [Tanacetum coccineum]|uniref:Uncharacterized protein n=1 Tax=Tanacetum coccineum TaxID=301880 RepID=A0ABQ5GS28_9ASTR
MGLWYPKDFGFELTAFSDADHAGFHDTRKSTSGGIQFLGDKLFSWMSKKQDCTAISSAVAEYMALSASCAQVMWMRIQLKDYGFNYNKIPLISEECRLEIELTTGNNHQQGASKGEKRLETRGHTYAVRITLLSYIEDDIMRPSDAMHNPSQPFGFLSKKLVSFVTEIHNDSLTFPHSEIVKLNSDSLDPTFTIKSTDKAALKEYDQKSTLYQTMHANKSFNRNPVNHQLYHALMEALIEDKNAIDKGVAHTVQDHKRKHDDDEDDDDEDPPTGPNQGKNTKRRRTKESKSSKNPSTAKETPKGKAPSKGSKTGKSSLVKEPVKEPIAEVVMDDAGDDVVHDDDQPQDSSKPNTAKTPNPEWFTQPPRPPTPDQEWNKRQVVLD